MTNVERKAARFALTMKVWTISLKGQIPDEAHKAFEKDVEEFFDDLLGTRTRDAQEE